MKTIAYSRSASKELATLPAVEREAIIAKVRRYAETRAGNTKSLQGREGARIRVGDFRAIIDESADTITVVKVGNRRDIYR